MRKKVVWGGMLTILFLGSILLSLFERCSNWKTPTFDEVKNAYRTSDALLLDRYGEVIHELRTDPKVRRLEWVTLKDISPALIRAVLQTEDRRFFRHHGVDALSLISSVVTWPKHRTLRGASTVTMQLVSLLDDGLKAREPHRSLSLKWRQIKAARRLEKVWTKEQILEAYLNLISFRGELVGIAAAARGLFGKAPGGLNEVESWILAALPASPNAGWERVARRAAQISRAGGGGLTAEEIQAKAASCFKVPYTLKPSVTLAPHAARMLLSGEVRQIRTTLDGKLQRFALETLDHYLASLKEGHAFDGAVLVVENKTGEVLAYVGNSGRTSSAAWVDGIRARRQAGSTLKPFLYGLAMKKGLITPASLIEDTPLAVPLPSGLYVPQNYDTRFHGLVSLRTALASSLNVPAVKTLLLVGVEAFWEKLRELGLDSLTEEPEHYGYALALGSADVSLLELVNAYRTLANGGRFSEMKIRLEGRTGPFRRVMDERVAFILSHILSDREARSLTFGLENPLATRFWTAVKTGTSKDMRDNWCVGYSECFTVGVWVGNFSGEPMQQVSGVSGAAPVWLAVMNELHRGRPSRPPQPPQGVVRARISFETAGEAEREEYFLKGTEPLSSVGTGTFYESPRILSPQAETLIRMDPEIPEDRQRVPFRFHPAVKGYQWVLNGRETGVYDPFFLWKPEPGRHVLSIVGPDKGVKDAVEFTVR